MDTLKVQKPLIWKTDLPLRNILYQMIQVKRLGFLFFAVGYYTFFFNMPRQFYCVLTLKFQLIRKYLLNIAMYKLPDLAVIIYYLNSQRMELHKTMTFLLNTSFIPLTPSYKCVYTHTHTAAIWSAVGWLVLMIYFVHRVTVWPVLFPEYLALLPQWLTCSFDLVHLIGKKS